MGWLGDSLKVMHNKEAQLFRKLERIPTSRSSRVGTYEQVRPKLVPSVLEYGYFDRVDHCNHKEEDKILFACQRLNHMT